MYWAHAFQNFFFLMSFLLADGAEPLQMSFWYDSDPCHLSYTAFFDVFVDSFFLVQQTLNLTFQVLFSVVWFFVVTFCSAAGALLQLLHWLL